MARLKTYLTEKDIRFLFDVSLILKGVFSVIEIAGGIAAYFVSQQFLIDLANLLTRGELSEDPRDFIANFLVQSAHAYAASSQTFIAFYLISHGAIKLWLIDGLLRKRLWYYPVALIVFTLFIAYQLYRFTYTHSLWLIFLTVLDLIVIVLTWHEYHYLRRHLAEAR